MTVGWGLWSVTLERKRIANACWMRCTRLSRHPGVQYTKKRLQDLMNCTHRLQPTWRWPSHEKMVGFAFSGGITLG